MYSALKKMLWAEADSIFGQHFGARSQTRSGSWRVYRFTVGDLELFITGEYFDISGGKFSFCLGISNGDYPTQRDTPSDSFQRPDLRGFSLVSCGAFGLPAARVDLELDWQTPSADLIAVALQCNAARDMLNSLGVTSGLNRHLVSYGMLSAFSIDIPSSEYENVVEKFRYLLNQAVETSIGPGIARIVELMRN